MHEEIEKAFGRLTQVVLGRALSGVRAYEPWLERDVRMPVIHPSAVSGRPVYHPALVFSTEIVKSVKLDEWEGFSSRVLGAQEALAVTPQNAAGRLKDIAYTTPEAVLGQNVSVEECGAYGYSSYCYRGDSFLHSKFCAYCFWPRESEHVFGSDNAFASRFCLKCYCSTNLTRCFEVSHSASSSDCYFCHNIENCAECMFCFNVKAKRYAIGNVEYPKEEYMQIKKLVLAEICAKLEKDKKLELSIFNVGAKR